MSTNSPTHGARPTGGRLIATRIAALVAGAAALTGFALIAHSTGHDSMARGAISGGSVTLLIIAALWIFGRRAGTAGRIVGDEADERDRAHITAAFADSAVAMGLAALACTVAALYGMPAPLVGGAIIWAGLAAGLISVVIRTRRG